MKVSKIAIGFTTGAVAQFESPKNCGEQLDFELVFSQVRGNSRVVVFDPNEKTETVYNWEHVTGIEFTKS